MKGAPTLTMEAIDHGPPDQLARPPRLAASVDDGIVSRVFHPVFPSDRSAAGVLARLAGRPRGTT